MSQPASQKPLVPTHSQPQNYAAWARRGSGALLLAGILLFAYLVGPTLLWAYHVERAGRFMEQGLAWPAPRFVDALPGLRDNRALAQALNHLDTAIRWRENHPHAYRLAGHIHAARGDWVRAAEMLEQARNRAPSNPLYGWELGLAYERMQQIIQRAPITWLPIAPPAGQIEANGQRIYAPYCRGDQTQQCYVRVTTLTQPFATFPEGAPQEAQALFLFYDARVSIRADIPEDRPMLQFLVGLEPTSTGQQFEDVTVRLLIAASNSAPELVTEITIERATALRGWMPVSADLSAWIGQTVTLIVETDHTPPHNADVDQYGIANVELTSVNAVRYAALQPAALKIQAWHAAGFHAVMLDERGEQAQTFGRINEAAQWRKRAFEMRTVFGDD